MVRSLYRKRIKRYVPYAVFSLYNGIKTRLHIRFSESDLAFRYLDGLTGLEIGTSAHNPFGLDTKNVDNVEDNHYKRLERGFVGRSASIDIIASGDDIPLPDGSQDFVVSAHVIEHFPDPINTKLTRSVPHWNGAKLRFGA